ncbi:MAG: SAM-dependent methyltransferase [Kiritimatiellaeota bacterium]|nr:SAM-dependent methyltransferase [Kiritimatiellota bacterium]
MPKPDFKDDWKEAVSGIVSAVFDLTAFVSATFTVKDAPEATLRVRAVELKEDTFWQFSENANSENLPRVEASRRLRDFLFARPIHEAHVLTSDTDYHYRVSKKGRVLFSKGAAAKPRDPAAVRAHDKVKDHPLSRFDSTHLLRVLGLADESGNIKSATSAKYRQVNDFLRELVSTFNFQLSTFNLYDIGCGKAYLSFCVKAYLEATIPGMKIHLTGIDIKENVIASCKRMAEALGWEKETNFVCSDIRNHKPGSGAKPDIVISLHACDTATDEALAFGVENNAALIFCAPCCQHELQTQLVSNTKHRALLRNAILRERFADILTDTFRAQILRVAGYKTTVVEFAEPDATARNILIKASRTGRGGNAAALAEYHDLTREWECEPYLAKRLPDVLPG